MQYFIYILASRPRGALYTGMTNNLAGRVDQHRSEVADGFTKKYHIHKLVHFEVYDRPEDAIRREKNIKAWQRAWKIELIENNNPDWKDLSGELLD